MANSAKILFVLMLLSLVSSCVSESRVIENEGFSNALNSVVKIDVWTRAHKNGDSRLERSLGSGAIITEDGLIITNAHVVNEYAENLLVTLSNLERVKAHFVGWDHWTDLALIKLDSEELKRRKIKLAHARFGNSAKLSEGDVVYAMGTPHGYARTVTRGIVSNTSRYFSGTILESGYETGQFNTWIQTDAAINSGNSGGPLVKEDGEIMGINARARTNSNNLGFAIPSDIAKDVVEKLTRDGQVKRAYIGIGLAPLQDMENYFDVDANKGALIENVDAGSPAKLAGISAGDILLKINEYAVDGRFPEQLPSIMNKIAKMKIGDELHLTILRDGKTLQKTLKTEKLESRIGREFALEKWGLGVREITMPYAREEKLPAGAKLMVAGVRQGFPFELAKINRGDVILSVNSKPIRSTKELKELYAQFEKSPKKILVEIMRGFSVSFHIVEPMSGK